MMRKGVVEKEFKIIISMTPPIYPPPSIKTHPPVPKQK